MAEVIRARASDTVDDRENIIGGEGGCARRVSRGSGSRREVDKDPNVAYANTVLSYG